jgi:hypothetical protein
MLFVAQFSWSDCTASRRMPADVTTIRSRRGLANALFNQNRFPEAEPEYRKVLELAEKVLGREHLLTLDACFDLAGNLARENKLPEAKQLAKRAADTARRALGPNHPATQKYIAFQTDLEKKNTL